MSPALVSPYELGQIARAAEMSFARNPFTATRSRLEWADGWRDEDTIIENEKNRHARA